MGKHVPCGIKQVQYRVLSKPEDIKAGWEMLRADPRALV